MTAELRVEWLDERTLPGLVALFERDGSPCYCRYWHFDGDKNAWLERCATAPEKNRAALEQGVRDRAAHAAGLVAIAEDGTVVGWMKLVPRAALPKLVRLPTYRSLDLGPDDGVFAVGCFLIDPAHRRRGVARALVRAATRLAEGAGARAIDAFPRQGIHPAEAWTGPFGAFEGFEHLAGEPPYPVLRKKLAGG